MKTLLIARNQIMLLLKSPLVLALFIIAPFFMIFIWGQAFTAIFAKSGPGIKAMDYFGITLLTFAVFQGASFASWGIFKERKANTELRLSLAPIGKATVVYGIFLGAWISLFALSCLVMLLTKVLLSVNFGASIGLALLLLAAESCLAAAVGVSFAVLFGQERTASSILSSFVPLLVFLGGGYMPIPDQGFLHEVSAISPIRWLNLAMLSSAIGQEGKEYSAIALLFCALLSIALLGSAGIKAWRTK